MPKTVGIGSQGELLPEMCDSGLGLESHSSPTFGGLGLEGKGLGFGLGLVG